MDFMQKNHYNRLTRRMTEYFFSEDTCRNTFFSPLSILVLLAVAAESTAGDTRVEILKLFRDYQGTNEFGRTLAGFQKSISRGIPFRPRMLFVSDRIYSLLFMMVKVVSPPELVEEIRETIRKMAAEYQV